jgi:predicted DNA binding CopG/RHH family protein
MKIKQVHLKLESQTLALVRIEAKKEGLNVQNCIRRLIALALQQEGSK